MFIDPPTFILVHVCLSVVGILAGLVMVGGFMAGARFDRWIVVFLLTTALTTLTGFGFPFVKVLPSHVVGVVSVPLLLLASVALYGKHLRGAWRAAFVVCSVAALYLNVFVLLAQLFQKIPAMAMLAPTPAAPAFGITQSLALALFLGMGWAAVRGFRAPRD